MTGQSLLKAAVVESAQTLLNGMNRSFGFPEVDGGLQTKSREAMRNRRTEYQKISELLGEEYSSDLRNTSFQWISRCTPFGGITVAKVFPNKEK